MQGVQGSIRAVPGRGMPAVLAFSLAATTPTMTPLAGRVRQRLTCVHVGDFLQMIGFLQRARGASVEVDGECIGRIGDGLMVLVLSLIHI